LNPTPASIRARAEAESIAGRLLAGEATAAQLAREYGCGRNLILIVYRTRTTPQQRRAARVLRAASTPASLRARADADRIIARLLKGRDTTLGLAAEYGCDVETINRVYRAGTTRRQRENARRRKLSAFRTGRAPACAGYNRGDSSFGPWLKPFHFRKGELRGTPARRWRPVGTISVHRDKSGAPCRMIKVRDGDPPAGRWIPYARWLWERDHGPVPPGHRVMHRNLQTLDDRPENLVCVTGAEALQMMSPGAIRKQRERAARKRKQNAVLQKAAGDVRRAGAERLFARQREAGLSNVDLSAATGIDCVTLYRMRKGLRLLRESERLAITEAVEAATAAGRRRIEPTAEPFAKERAARRVREFLSSISEVAA
jgi:hypothetical protein